MRRRPVSAFCNWRGLAFGWWGNTGVCPGEVWDPYLSLGRLLVVERPDACVDEIIQQALPGGGECPESPHIDGVVPCGRGAMAKRL